MNKKIKFYFNEKNRSYCISCTGNTFTVLSIREDSFNIRCDGCSKTIKLYHSYNECKQDRTLVEFIEIEV